MKEGHSKYKEKIKKHLGIRAVLRFLQFTMSAKIGSDFLNSYDVETFAFTPAELVLGVLIVADG